MVAVDIHPEDGHEGEEMPDVEGGGSGVDANISADALVGHKFIDSVSVAMG